MLIFEPNKFWLLDLLFLSRFLALAECDGTFSVLPAIFSVGFRPPGTASARLLQTTGLPDLQPPQHKRPFLAKTPIR